MPFSISRDALLPKNFFRVVAAEVDVAGRSQVSEQVNVDLMNDDDQPNANGDEEKVMGQSIASSFKSTLIEI
jgi:hypothetical protein